LILKDINLLPDELRESEEGSSKKSIDLKTVAIGLFALMFLTAIFFIPQLWEQALTRQKEDLEAQIADVKYDEVRTVRIELADANNIVTTRKNVLESIDRSIYTVDEIFNTIPNIAPKGSRVETFLFSGRRVNISGTLSNDMQWAEMISRLNRISIIDADYKNDVNLSELNFMIAFDITGK
jgi:hypothetical protein